MNIIELETSRLRLRGWKKTDEASLFALNTSEQVMRFFPSVLTEPQNMQFMNTLMEKFTAQNGWGFWAVELKNTQMFIGFVGLNIPSAELPFSPCVEIGWRLLPQFWHQGYALEAAHAACEFAFNHLKLDEIVSFTAVVNTPSEAVMQKLGMVKDAQHFYHPALAPDHWLAEHVLYRLKKEHYLAK